jgi:hypothetical protein
MSTPRASSAAVTYLRFALFFFPVFFADFLAAVLDFAFFAMLPS